MPFHSIDAKRCNGDGTCVKACPMGLFYFVKGETFPRAVDNAAELCISCGHCVSVCPRDALSLEHLPREQFAALPPGWNLSLPQVELLLKGRRSIRSFKDQPVAREALEKLVDVARYAPSGVNRQPLRWKIIDGKEKVGHFAGLVVQWMRELVAQGAPIAQSLNMATLISAQEKGRDFICRGAPQLVITYALKDDMMAPGASDIALTYLDIAAASMGLGACWAGYCHMALNASAPCRELVKMNERCACYGAMLVGYPLYGYRLIPPRNKAKVTYI